MFKTAFVCAMSDVDCDLSTLNFHFGEDFVAGKFMQVATLKAFEREIVSLPSLSSIGL